jgi:peptide/nickel transport system substrate-binding protein
MDADPDPYDLWHSSQAATGANYPGLRDPEIDRWIERARETFDRTERESLYRQIGRKLHDLQPDTFFIHPNSRVAIARGLGGVAPSSMGLFNFWPGVHAWHRTG